MPRFAILEHDWPTLHWDLLLEDGAHLLSWRLLDEPGTARDIRAERNAVHRLMYLDYEGPVSGERGAVRRWDAGVFEWVAREEERIVLNIRGEKLIGTCWIDVGLCRFQ